MHCCSETQSNCYKVRQADDVVNLNQNIQLFRELHNKETLGVCFATFHSWANKIYKVFAPSAGNHFSMKLFSLEKLWTYITDKTKMVKNTEKGVKLDTSFTELRQKPFQRFHSVLGEVTRLRRPWTMLRLQSCQQSFGRKSVKTVLWLNPQMHNARICHGDYH